MRICPCKESEICAKANNSGIEAEATLSESLTEYAACWIIQISALDFLNIIITSDNTWVTDTI